MKLTEDQKEDLLGNALAQMKEVAGNLLRFAIRDLEDADNSDGFKIAVSIDAGRKGKGAMLTLQTQGTATVALKHKEKSEATVIDWNPALPLDPGETP